jgi:hypothetical protein
MKKQKLNPKDFNNQFATLKLREEIEEDSVTSSGEAYNPALSVPKKKYKGLGEGDGYEEVKGFRPGHTKDKGGFLYKDLWGVNEDEELEGDEEFMVGDEVRVKTQGMKHTGMVGKVKNISTEGNFYDIVFRNGDTETYNQEDLEDKNVALQGAPSEDDGLQENYHRFKRETVTRSKEQQMHEAMKVVRKKLQEASKNLSYLITMKEELGLQEYNSHSSKLMESLKGSIAEIYTKYKQAK